jgi:hypothetical protein
MPSGIRLLNLPLETLAASHEARAQRQSMGWSDLLGLQRRNSRRGIFVCLARNDAFANADRSSWKLIRNSICKRNLILHQLRLCGFSIREFSK